MKKILAGLALGLTVLSTGAFSALILPDSYDVLFAQMNGTTTAFGDSSNANTKTITAHGNATQLPIKLNKSAGYFSGSATSYAKLPDSADWDFGTADYDVEFFVNMQVVTNSYFIDVNTNGFSVCYAGGAWYVSQAGANRIAYTTTPSANTWYHIRVQRVSGVTKLYIDNVERGSYTGSDNIQGGTTGLFLGINTAVNGSYIFTGWLKELRISNASRTVAVPTAEYTADANTVLLMHFDTPANSPLGPAIYFDGTGDSVSVAYAQLGTDMNFGTTGDYTIEFWVNFTSFPGQYSNLFSRANAAPLQFYYDNTNHAFTNWVSSYSYVATANIWHHVAATRASGVAKLWLDGVQVDSDANSTDMSGTGDAFFGTYSTGVNPVNGYMREIRVSNVSRYTTAFTPSQSGFTVDANTKLYIKGNENNGVTTFIDSETSAKTVTTVGDTKIKYTEDYRSCIFVDAETTPKYPYPVGSAKVDFFAIGAGVGFFDGAGDYLTVPTATDFDFGTGNCTIELYYRPQDYAAAHCLYYRWTANTGIILGDLGTSFSFYTAAGGGTVSKSWTFSSPLKTWEHIALVRVSGVWSLYVNGTSLGTYNEATATDYTGTLYLGTFSDGSTWSIKGLEDNIRISKGIARYTAAFNPPEDYASARSDGMLSVF